MQHGACLGHFPPPGWYLHEPPGGGRGGTIAEIRVWLTDDVMEDAREAEDLGSLKACEMVASRHTATGANAAN